MAMIFAPRVKETTTTTGTGTYSLGGAVTGYQGFVAGIGNTNQTWYCCTDGTDWEIGIGVVTDASTDTFSRDTVVNSSNSNSAVNWGAGSKDIFVISPPYLLNAVSGDWSIFNGGSGDANTVYRDEYNYKNMALGFSNNVSGVGNTVIGFNHIIGGNYPPSYSLIVGKGGALYRGVPCLVQSSGHDINQGEYQTVRSTYAYSTTDASASYIAKGFALVGAYSETGTVCYEIIVVARQRGGSSGTVGDSKAWKLEFMSLYASGARTLVGSVTSTVIAASAGASSWACTIDLSQIFPIRITGEDNKTIVWVASVKAVENSIVAAS